jgi:hypothetical protein
VAFGNPFITVIAAFGSGPTDSRDLIFLTQKKYNPRYVETVPVNESRFYADICLQD